MTRYRFSERQMAFYAACHRDKRNRVTHYFGVPIIIFSLLLAGALWRGSIAGLDLSAAHALALAALVLWLSLDLAVGLALLVLLLPVFVLADTVATSQTAATVWWLFAVSFAGGWTLQLIGHHFEGRRPALVDNLFQIFIAPMYLTAELLFSLGLCRGLAGRIEACRRALETGETHPSV